MALPSTSSMWRDRRVFITGATGLLGSHLTATLVQEGAAVVALVRDGVPQSLFYERQLQRQVVCVRGELEDEALPQRILSEYAIETVFHLGAQTIVSTAAQAPVATFKANIAGTWNILEACRQHRPTLQQLIVASSDKAYGSMAGDAYDEAHPLQGRYPYDVSKSCADLLAQSYFHTYGLPVCITRCGNFFGPGDLNISRLIPGTIQAALAGQAPQIRSNGQYIRDYLYVEDGVHAYLTLAAAMQRHSQAAASAQATAGTAAPTAALPPGPIGQAFNFSYGLRLTALAVVQEVLRGMGRTDLQPTILGTAAAEIVEQSLDAKRARQQLRWEPRHGFAAGLEQTIAWYRGRAAAGPPP